MENKRSYEIDLEYLIREFDDEDSDETFEHRTIEKELTDAEYEANRKCGSFPTFDVPALEDGQRVVEVVVLEIRPL